MSEHPLEDLDAVVIGANLRGLVTAHVLSRLGYRAVVLERGPHPGGADGSFTTAGGSTFDHGLHLLDWMRSELATRLFLHAVDGRVHRQTLRRAIVLRGSIMPYAPCPEQMPEPLRRMLPRGELVDDLGEDAPTREALSRIYGPFFTELVFDEVLPSFPTESRHLAFGVDESRLLTNIYPWFFPRAERRSKTGDLSRSFHDKLRGGVAQDILYPMEGGFGGFAAGFARHLDPERVQVLTGATDLHLELRPGTHTVEWASALGRRFCAPRFFWAGPWAPLCRILDIPCQDAASDWVVLGSFRLDRPARSDYHELLVGDPTLRINRVSFPGEFRRSGEPLMQIEFAFPAAEDWPLDPEHWRETWLGDARALRLLSREHQVEEFDFRKYRMHFNAFGVEGEPLRDSDPTLLRADSNVHPVTPSMANLNLNAYVPRAVAYVADVLSRAPA